MTILIKRLPAPTESPRDHKFPCSFQPSVLLAVFRALLLALSLALLLALFLAFLKPSRGHLAPAAQARVTALIAHVYHGFQSILYRNPEHAPILWNLEPARQGVQFVLCRNPQRARNL
ncbi:hypothetical protein C8A05DRAFT_37867 [Staphylotrichum tortipilum]|uniref:Uncharacterized protein n=1 Tax=Staphylotrichum tortipilum TaxID=2831512 RepID=A0AAN6RPE7_9PEZI|nr:hypothetical protein C8A05DRAFT_37867 [Staphylotrichum longicolle]